MTTSEDPFDFVGVEWANDRCIRAEDFELQESMIRRRMGWQAALGLGLGGRVLRLRVVESADLWTFAALAAIGSDGSFLQVDEASTGPIQLRGPDLSANTTRLHDLFLVAPVAHERLEVANDAEGLCARARPKPAILARPIKDHQVDPDACVVFWPGSGVAAVRVRTSVGIDGTLHWQGPADEPPVRVTTQVRIARVEVTPDHRMRRVPDVLPAAATVAEVDWLAAEFSGFLRDLRASHEKLGEQLQYQTNKIWVRRLLARWHELYLHVVDELRDFSRRPETLLATYRRFHRLKAWSIEAQRSLSGDEMFPKAEAAELGALQREFLDGDTAEELGSQVARLRRLAKLDHDLTRQVVEQPVYFLKMKADPPDYIHLRQSRYKRYHFEVIDPHRIIQQSSYRVYVSQPKMPQARDVQGLVLVLRTDIESAVDQAECRVRLVYRGGESEPDFPVVFRRDGSFHYAIQPPAASRHALANLQSVELISDPALTHHKLHYYYLSRGDEVQVETVALKI